MSANSDTNVLAQTVAAIDLNISEGRWTAMLPSLDAIAQQLNVSLSTVRRAVRHLREKGQLESRRGKGVWVAGHCPGRESGARNIPRLSRPEQIASEIRQNLLSGGFPLAGKQLSLREISAHYSCGFRSARDALALLASEGVVRRVGRSFHIGGVRQSKGSAAIAFVGFWHRWAGFQLSEAGVSMYQALEHLCAEQGIEFIPVPFTLIDRHQNTMRHFIPRWEENVGNVPLLGIVYSPYFVSAAEEMFRFFRHRYQCPLAIVNAARSSHVTWPTGMSKQVRTFNTANSRDAGVKMANYLLDRGHRTIGFISQHPHDDWSKQRLAGLTAAMNRAGGKVIAGGEFLNPGELSNIRSDMELALDRSIDQLTGCAIPVPPSGIIAVQLERALWIRATAKMQRSWFKRLLEQQDVTAWVGANDNIAMLMMEFLAEAGKNVPEDVCVAGFDNSLHGNFAGLTTMEFHGDKLARAVLRFLLDYPGKRRTTEASTVEFQGTIIPRRSTRRTV